MTAILLTSLALAGCPQNKWEQAILDKHNEWRASTQPPAKDMYNLRWDSAIAKNMHSWLARCDSNWPHSDQDKDRANVGGYEFLGENLAYCAGIACEDPIDGIVGYLGQSWWDEKDDYDWGSDSSRGGVTSHYTQMSSSNIYAIGCAAVECPSPGPYGWNGKWWEIGCQYGERGQGYWVGTKPFEQGSGGLIEPDKALFKKHPEICADVDTNECDATPCGADQTCNDPDMTNSGDFVCTCKTDMTKMATGKAADCSTPPPAATPPPAMTPPAGGTPPATPPAGGNPPAGNPPAGNPPAGNPPAGNPPAGNPPAGNPPAGNPPAGNPPAGNPPAGNPPAGNPPAGNPPAGNPPAGNPPTAGGYIPVAGAPRTEAPEGSDSKWWIWVIVAFGLLACCAMAAFVVVRTRSQAMNFNDFHDQPSDYQSWQGQNDGSWNDGSWQGDGSWNDANWQNDGSWQGSNNGGGNWSPNSAY